VKNPYIKGTVAGALSIAFYAVVLSLSFMLSENYFNEVFFQNPYIGYICIYGLPIINGIIVLLFLISTSLKDFSKRLLMCALSSFVLLLFVATPIVHIVYEVTQDEVIVSDVEFLLGIILLIYSSIGAIGALLITLFKRKKDLYKRGGAKIFSNGFPHIDDEIVSRAIATIPLETYRNVNGRVSDNNISYLLEQTQVSFPYRLYSLDVEDSVLEKLEHIEKTILHCIYTRSCDGYVREKHIKALLIEDFPEWAIPYIVKVCDEYVVEILQTVYDNLKGKNTEKIKKFCSDNRETFCKSYNRMISYWNEFYRDRCYKFEDYIGRKLFIECFGANRKMTCTKS